MSIRISQATRALGAFFTVSLLILCGVSYFAIAHVRIGSAAYARIADSKDLTADILPPPLYLVEAHLAFEKIKSDPSTLTLYRPKLAELHRDYEARVAYWRKKTIHAKAGKILFGASDAAAQSFWTALETQAIPAIEANDPAKLAAANALLDTAYEAQRAAVVEMVPLLDAETKTAEADAAASVKFSNLLLLGTGLFVGAASVLALGLLRKQVVTPVEAMTGYMGRLAVGNYDLEPHYLERGDEIGEMAKSVGVFRENALERRALREAQEAAETNRREAERMTLAERAEAERQRAEVVAALAEGLSRLAKGELTCRLEQAFPPEYEGLRTDFNAAITALDQVMANIGDATAGVRTGSDEIGHAADDLARRTEQQAASLEETAAALEQLTATVKGTASGALEARQFVTDARRGAEQSGVVVTDAVSAMARIAESSHQITQIIGVIDEIAFQTNLLALNAGVEAARAGEAGRGFAVVASEVRALAQRSADAAKQIKGLIAESGGHVKSGVDLVSQAGEALGVIVQQVTRIDELMGSISSSTGEQATGLGEVNIAITQMDQMTQQNAAMVEQTTAAVHSMRGSAGDLVEQIAVFKTSGAPAQAKAPPRPPAQGRAPATRSFGALALATPAPQAQGEWEDF
jgi:methyl-accepting chemotaxis protein